MNDEIEDLNCNATWVIINSLKDRKPNDCKWIYNIKYRSSGDIEHFKACLIAKGYNKREAFDFDETFSLGAIFVTMRCIIAMVVNFNWNLYQLDINNAFMYGSIEEEVYVFTSYFIKNDKQVCKLVNFLHGLKQAPHKSDEYLTSFLSEFGLFKVKVGCICLKENIVQNYCLTLDFFLLNPFHPL